MSKNLDYVIGQIKIIEEDKNVFWLMYLRSDRENEQLRKELEKVKRRLKKYEP